MAEKDTPNFDEDFQFDDFDQMDQTSSMQSKAKPAGAAQDEAASNQWQAMDKKNPRKLIISGVIIAIIIALLVYHFVTSSSDSLLNLKHPKATEVAPPVATSAQTPNAAAPVPTPAQPSAIDTLSSQVKGVEQTINQQQETITQLQGNISNLQDSVNNLNTTLDNVTQQLTTLTNRIPKPAPKKAAPRQVAPPPVNYIVKAMVPGRAWIQGSNGQTLSVVVGNTVPDHGTVSAVDVNNGQVVMSDGSVFSYDINGN